MQKLPAVLQGVVFLLSGADGHGAGAVGFEVQGEEGEGEAGFGCAAEGVLGGGVCEDIRGDGGLESEGELVAVESGVLLVGYECAEGDGECMRGSVVIW